MKKESHIAEITIAVLGLSALGMSIGLIYDLTRWTFLAFFLMGVLGMIWAWKTNVLTLKQVLWLSAVVRVIMLPLPPVLTDDMYRYLWDGKMMHESINPYRYAPNDPRLAQYWDSPLFTKMNSPSFFTAYLPVTQLGFYLSTFFDNWRINYYLLKILFALAEFLTVLMLAKIIPPRSLILYALHPLIWVEFAGQAHSEAFMLPLLAAMFFFYHQNKTTSALVSGALAVGTKLYPIFFIPFLLNRIGWKKAGWGFLVAFVMLLPFWFPLFVPNFLSSLKLYTQWFEFGAGLYTILKLAAQSLFQADLSKEIGPFLQSLFFVSVIALFYVDVKKQTLEEVEPPHLVAYQEFLQFCMLVLGVYLLTATTVHPWYLSGVLLLVALLSAFQTPQWHWIWLTTFLPGTYLFYNGIAYLEFIFIAWIGWFVLLVGQPFFKSKKLEL